jgi:predicted porin
MKKSLVLAALAATIAAPAFAQSSVTVYGRLNVTVERSKVVGEDSTNDVNNNGSRIGFKGVEDLGGGLKAGFILEHRFDPTTGTQSSSAFWGGAGQSEVNLSGNFGMVRLGLFTAESYFATSDWIDMHNHGTGDSADALYVGYGAVGNKVAYRTPTLGTFWAEVSAAEGDTASNGDRYYDLAANYEAGALKLGAGFSKAGDAKQFAVRALYELGAFTFGGYVQRQDQFVGFGKSTSFRLAGMYTMGATEFHLNYGQAGDIDNTGNSDAKQATVGINQNLSKRTKVYVYYTKVGGPGVQLYGLEGQNHWALGVRHNF